MRSQFLIRGIFLLGLTGLMTACGDDKSPTSRPDFSQNVNEIHYDLKRVDVRVEVVYQDGSVARLNTVLNSERDLNQEKILRVTQDGQYFLEVNGKNAELNIGASADFDAKKDRRGQDTCTWTGRTEAAGEAEFDRLNFTWRLVGTMNGKNCPETLSKEYEGFVHDEIDALHLSVMQKIRDAGLLNLKDSRQLKVEVKIQGAGK